MLLSILEVNVKNTRFIAQLEFDSNIDEQALQELSENTTQYSKTASHTSLQRSTLEVKF